MESRQKLPHGLLTYADFDVLHAPLALLDDYLDCAGVPVCYRKYCIRQLLRDCRFGEPYPLAPEVLSASLAINDRLLRRGLTEDAIRRWYADVYEHLSVRLPVSGLVCGFSPQPLVVSLERLLHGEVCFPGSIVAEADALETWNELISTRPEVVKGLEVFSALPPIPWVLLSMANYDMAVSCFRQSKPAFHLAQWETAQAIEKLLKAILIAKNFPESKIKSLGHHEYKILPALNAHGVIFSSAGDELIKKILNKGNPDVRYEEAMDRNTRAQQKRLALELHHDFLTFCAMHGAELKQALPTVGSTATFPFCTDSFETLKREVAQEHADFCGSSDGGHSCHMLD